MFDDLNEMIAKAFTYKPMTDEDMQISCVNDIKEWAEGIAGEWHDSLRAVDGDPAEERSGVGCEIIKHCEEIVELIEYLKEL